MHIPSRLPKHATGSLHSTAGIPRSILYVAGMLALGYIFIVYSVIFGKVNVKCDSSSNLSKDTNPHLRINPAVRENSDVKRLQEEVDKLQKELAEQAAGGVSSTQVISGDIVSGSSGGAFRPGLIVLGMHRSGTSIVGGLLNKMGLKTGGPLIMPASDNEKGFFERIDVVLQNDIIMGEQGVSYSSDTYRYDAKRGLTAVLEKKIKFKEGERGLKFLNSRENFPWMLKDPRLCITLRTWLPLLDFIPAVLFTYRHPMDVAHSLNTRYEKFPYGRSLRMWYVYNKRAVRQSQDLCRVTTSHQKMMQQPAIELERIFSELHNCGVPAPRKVTEAEIASFVDPKLQHGRAALKDESCNEDLSQLLPPKAWPTTDMGHIALYREVMRVFCALEDGSAYKYDFRWDDSIRD